MKDYFGIDFGTTNTSVCHIRCDDAGIKTNVLGEDGKTAPFPSYLCVFADNRYEIGGKVKGKRNELIDKATILSSFKSYLGTKESFDINGKTYNAERIAAIFLKAIKASIKQYYGIDITEASFSFPVDFTAKARRDLRLAAERVGIKTKGFVSESTAAYLATRKRLKGMSRVMVVDWGGGTLDISILEIHQSKIREIAVYGKKIGGDDIDRELAILIHGLLNQKIDSHSRCQFSEMPLIQQDKLVAICEQIKIQISDDGEDYSLTIRDYGNYGTKTVTVTVEMFEDIVKPIILKRVLKAINTAMEQAEMTKTSIDSVIIAGGSSNLRPFATAITNLFGEEKIIIPDNTQSVSAEGAALMQIIGGNFKLDDDVGIVMSDDSVFPILKKNVAGVGTKSENFSFSLTEDSFDAHFIVTNSDGRKIYKKDNVPTKGFLRERLEVSAEIKEDQIAYVKIHSNAMPPELSKTIQINKLTFHYDLSELDRNGGDVNEQI